ncbi:MAG: ATPase [Caldithrix sp.]|nr:ATPase [Caldithrix sp.]
MQDSDHLKRLLQQIDNKGYKAYKRIAGGYRFDGFQLFIDHVQGDPFAAPSKLRLRVGMDQAAIPDELYANTTRRIAMEDFLIRQTAKAMQTFSGGIRGTGKSGVITIDEGGQEVIQRTAMVVNNNFVEARIYVGLPAAGRTILGKQADRILFEQLPNIVNNGLLWRRLPQQEAYQFVECIENQEHIRALLPKRQLAAFIAEDSILPRRSGASDAPMSPDDAIPFSVPDAMRVDMPLLNPIQTHGQTQSTITGLGIPVGVTLIAGGGYHGKSTVLNSLERGVYPHIPGDGREYVITNPHAVKIRAEDGRSVQQVDISPFINNLPYGRTTQHFSSDDASGSTSQAANIMEALEAGARALLLDEDTSATNFMIRDARMQALVHRDDEPITPFLDRVRELYEHLGVSTILVMGGSGDYLTHADHVLVMKNYRPYEMTDEARQISRQYPTQRQAETALEIRKPVSRIPSKVSFDASRGKKQVKIDAKNLDTIVYGRTAVDIRYLEQLVDISQAQAIAYGIHLLSKRFLDENTLLCVLLDKIENVFQTESLDVLDPFYRQDEHPGSFARPRRFELAAAINRFRTLKMRQQKVDC